MAFPATEFLPHPLNNGIPKSNPGIGPAIPGTDTDPSSKMSAANGLDLSSVDYEPKYLFRRVQVNGGASGVTMLLQMKYANGGQVPTPIVVPANDMEQVDGDFKGIVASGTTTTGNLATSGVIPIF
jgi:hypothetical protein